MGRLGARLAVPDSGEVGRAGAVHLGAARNSHLTSVFGPELGAIRYKGPQLGALSYRFPARNSTKLAPDVSNRARPEPKKERLVAGSAQTSHANRGNSHSGYLFLTLVSWRAPSGAERQARCGLNPSRRACRGTSRLADGTFG